MEINLASNESTIKRIRISLRRLFFIIILICFPEKSFSMDETRTRLKSTKFQLQYAGNLGLFSVGLGKGFFNEKLNTFLIYGYLPEQVHGAQVHTIALKGSIRLGKSIISPIFDLDYYTGGLVLYGITDNTYFIYPDYFPDDYYGTNAIHASFHFGLKLNKNRHVNKISQFSFYTELGTLDYQVWYALKNATVELFDIWNICLGMTIAF
jgi:hypothetical protein